jgi:quercetin dioxygenase-like cupin family protein
MHCEGKALIQSPGGGEATPRHVHPNAEETFYVLDGEIVVRVDGDDHRLGAGSTTTVLRGTPHAPPFDLANL